MSLLFVRDGSGGGDPVCPWCQATMAAEWDNEYGDPEPGYHTSECPSCHKKISAEVSIHYSIGKAL